VTQVDTASGVVNDIEAIGKARDAAGSDALLLVDAVASLGCMPFRDGCLGRGRRDGGLAERPDDAARPLVHRRGRAGARGAQEADMRTPYWDWTFRDGEVHYHKYCGTPPEHLLFGLRVALDMIFAEGLDERVRAPPPARGGDAPRGRHLGGRGRRSRSTRPSRRALRHGDDGGDAQRRKLDRDRGLLPRQVRRHPRARARRA
jgi:hypothetical protein